MISALQHDGFLISMQCVDHYVEVEILNQHCSMKVLWTRSLSVSIEKHAGSVRTFFGNNYAEAQRFVSTGHTFLALQMIYSSDCSRARRILPSVMRQCSVFGVV